ncbi:hypothetical protein V8D89_005217 [Ganoderma adspersum]
MSETTSSSANTSTDPSVPEERVADSSEHGRGQQGRGRGRGHGRGGRGRGGAVRGGRGGPAGFGGGYANFQAGPIYPPPNTVLYPPRTPYREPQAPRPRLTHFISIPLGHNEALRDTVSAFTKALLEANPSIPGLDATIVVPARRLHFTLGVMSLGSEDTSVQASAGKVPGTLDAAKKVLQEVRPKIMELLGEEAFRISLDSLDIMKPEGGDRARAHVMWVGPAEGEGLKKLEEVGKLVQSTFKTAGLLVDEDRPLKTHCTVLNTVYRKPALKWRFPFSYQSVLASDALKGVLVQKDAVDASKLDRGRRGPIRIDLGECPVDEIQICEMGSWGPEGEYVAVARESLTGA